MSGVENAGTRDERLSRSRSFERATLGVGDLVADDWFDVVASGATAVTPATTEVVAAELPVAPLCLMPRVATRHDRGVPAATTTTTTTTEGAFG